MCAYYDCLAESVLKKPFEYYVYMENLRKSLGYRKVPKFWDARNVCCNLPKIQTKRPNLKIFCQNGADGIANSEDPDQTAPL